MFHSFRVSDSFDEAVGPSFGVGGYIPNAVDVGTNDARGQRDNVALINSTEEKSGIASVWYRVFSVPPSFQSDIIRVGTSTGRGVFTLNNSGEWVIFGRNSVGATVLSASAGSVTVDGEWHHVLVTWDTAVNNDVNIYIDDVNQDVTISTFTLDGIIDWTVNDVQLYNQFDETGTDSKFDGCAADFYLTIGETLDIDIESNRRKFISAAGKPVFLGSGGSIPTGNQPIVFMNGNFNNYVVNAGFGGDFTAKGGAAIACSDNPAD
jgi:hypothetical protein